MPSANDLARALQAHPGAAISGEELARTLKVSTRTVRNYVRELNAGRRPIVVSSRDGYSLQIDAYQGYLHDHQREQMVTPSAPRERVPYILHTLVTADASVSVYALAEQLHVSDSTVEADLTRARIVAHDFGLALMRQGTEVSLQGDERHRRRLVRHIMTDVARRSGQFIDVGELARLTRTERLEEFKDNLVGRLAGFGLAANAGAADDLVAHIAIMADRVRTGHSISGGGSASPSELGAVGPAVQDLVELHFGISLPPGEVDYLGFLILQKTVPEEPSTISPGLADTYFHSDYTDLVESIVQEINSTFLIDLSSPRFMSFLTLHVRNLVERASGHDDAFVPGGLSVKNSHPLIHELAVFAAGHIQQATGVHISAAEIDLLSFHVGSRLQEMYDRDSRLSVVLLMPRYYDLDATVRGLVETTIAGFGSVDAVVTEPDRISALPNADMIVCGGPYALDDNVPVAHISMLPSTEDLEIVRVVAQTAWKAKNRERISAELSSLIDPALFIPNGAVATREDAIRTLCNRFIAAHVAEADIEERVWERERISATSFPSGFAIPHPITMSGNKSAIGVLRCGSSIDWGGQPVQLVAMFSVRPAERDLFGEIFEHFVRMLLSRPNVEALLSSADNFDAFMSCLHERLLT